METKDKIERLEELLRDSIEGQLVEQKATSLLPPGENFGSVMYRVDFKVKKEGEEEKEYHAVAKCTPPSEYSQRVFNTQVTFKSEIAWYTTVIPTLKKFAKEQGLKRELDFFQKFYGARISLNPNSDKVDLDGVILTENLKYSGYHNIDRYAGFDTATTLSILRDLATFHAVPLAIRLKDPKLFERNLKRYCPNFGTGDGSVKEEFDQEILGLLEIIPEVQPYMERIKKIIKESFAFEDRELREPWVTILHLDLWCNNVMVTGGEDSKNIFLDLQAPMIGSPVGDLIFLLLTSVNIGLIQEKFDEFVEYYYEEFIKNLEQLKIDTKVYTFEGFLEELDTEAKNTEFSHSLSFAKMVLRDKGEFVWDPSDVNFKPGTTEVKITPPNQRQIEKYKWVVSLAVKRKWI